MALEAIVYPLLVGVAGGIGSAVIGAYKKVAEGEEDFDARHFILSIPRALVGAVLALGVSGGALDVSTVGGILSVFAVGFTANSVLGKLWGANKVAE